MAEHSMALELYYNGVWNDAPVYERDGCVVMRGTNDIGNDTEPAGGSSTIDNRTGDYSPRSLVSNLRGLIGQNTKSRYVIDGDVVLTGEMASWKPERSVGGDAWTKAEVAGVLRRIGRGKDAFRSPLARAYAFEPPDRFWMLDDPKDTTVLAGTSPLLLIHGELELGGDFGVAGASSSLWAGKGAFFDPITSDFNAGAYLKSDFSSTGFSPTGWQVEFSGRYHNSTPDTPVVVLTVDTTGDFGTGIGWPDGAVNFILNPALWDGESHHVSFWLYQDGSDVKYNSYRDGVPADVGLTIGSGTTLGVPVGIEINRTGAYADTAVPSINAVALYATFHDPAGRAPAARSWVGESAGDRFSRVCTEQGITPTVVGDVDDTVLMGPQPLDTFLGILDEIARTDDASIFETRDSVGLTMRTGASRQNQEPALTVSYIGEVQPPLRPEYGDRGIRNDVTAQGAVGPDQRVEQLTGPRNVQAPEDDPQGVGRYATSLDVNPSTVEALYNAAGWRVNIGCFDGTWYAEITVDLDAAPHLTDDVAAIDIGDVLELTDTPQDESLESFRGLVVGIRNKVGTHRRVVTFYCIPAEPYQTGVLAETTGDTDPLVGHLETDGSTAAAASAGATTLTVTTNAGPVWTMDSDDFPLDIIVDGQRVSISGIAPKILDTFTRTVSNGWGTANTGETWAVTGTASEYSVDGASAKHSTPSAGTVNISTLTYAHDNLEFRFILNCVALPSFPAGGPASTFVDTRFNGSTDTIRFQVELLVNRTIRLRLVRLSSLGNVDLAVLDTGIPYGSKLFWVSCRVMGSDVEMRVWETSKEEPAYPTISAVDSVVMSGTLIRLISVLDGSWSGTTPYPRSYDEARVVSPQVFTVQAAGHQVEYPISAGASVTVQQPIILAQ